jgi:hypothetical protein
MAVVQKSFDRLAPQNLALNSGEDAVLHSILNMWRGRRARAANAEKILQHAGVGARAT